jgi:cytoskeletal protein CcmA (bactofilin family)
MAGTVIGVGLTVEGDVTTNEPIEVHGTVLGALTTSDVLSVGSGGTVQADVHAASVTVTGQLTGNVTASERVDLQPFGKLVGDVKAARLTIADGASFKGNVDMGV